MNEHIFCWSVFLFCLYIYLIFDFSGVDSSTQLGEVERRMTQPGFLPMPTHWRRPMSSTVARPPEYEMM